MRRVALAAVFCVLTSAGVQATRIRRLSLTEIRDAADAVLVVDVTGATQRVGDAGMVWTDYDVRIHDVLRGERHTGERMTLPFAGGRAGLVENGIAGVPRLSVGERYVVFLDAAPGRPVPAIGWGDGIIPVPRGTDRSLVTVSRLRLEFDQEEDRSRGRLPEIDDLRSFVAGTVQLSMQAAPESTGEGHGGSCTCGGYAAVPVPWEVEHRDQPEFAAAAMESFARWNRYIEVFSPHEGDGVMGPNGINEIGFLTLDATSAKYGIHIDRNVFAITFMSPLSAAGDFDACPKPPEASCGTFSETDVIMNAGFFRGFRAAGPPDFADLGPALYDATAVHELGHALGFHHNVNNISVMNLYEDFAARYVAAADTAEAYRAYPTQERVLDLAVYPFSFDPARTDYAATTPVEVSRIAGATGSITIRNFGFENVGTETINGVQIRFYLSTDSDVTPDDTLLGTLSFAGPSAPGAFWDDGQAGRSFKVPAQVTSGTYFLGALVSRGDGSVDDVTYNNAWTAPETVLITTSARRRNVRH